MNWLLFWLIFYAILVILFTLRHIRHRDLDHYLVNNRKTGTALLVFTTLSTFVGGGTSVGLIAMGYESGFAALGIGIAYVLGFFIVARFAAHIRQLGEKREIYSYPQCLNKTFTQTGSPAFRKLFSGMVTGVNVFIFFFLLAAQFVAMASVLKHVLGIEYLPAAILSCIIVIAYTAFAGLAGVIYTDMLQFFFILLMILFIFIPGIDAETEGLSLLRLLPKEMLNGMSYGWLFLVGLPLFIAPSVLVRMDIWQRILSARNEKAAVRMNYWSALGMLPFYVIFPLAGMAMRLKLGDGQLSEDMVYAFLERNTGPFAMGFAIVGLMAALMSSADSFLNVASISAVRDFAGWKYRDAGRQMSSGRQMSLIRLVSIVFGVMALLLALILPGIVNLMVVGIGTIAVFVPATLLALLHKHPALHRKEALVSIFSGFLVNVLLFVLGMTKPGIIDPKVSFIPAMVVSFLTLGVGMLFRKKIPR